MRWLVDADAFLGLRKLSLLSLLEERRVSLQMTEYIARHELSTVSDKVDALCEDGLLTVYAVKVKTPQKEKFNELKRSNDKGEAEAIAWAVFEEERPAFVSQDKRARKTAQENGLVAIELLDMMLLLVEAGAWTWHVCETS